MPKANRFIIVVSGFLCLVLAVTGAVNADPSDHKKLFPYISAEDDVVSDFAFSIATISSNILGHEIIASDRWNLAFFQGPNHLNGDQVNVDALGIKDEKLSEELSKIRTGGQRCVVQEYGSIMIVVSSYEDSTDDKTCFVVALSHFYELREFSPVNDLSGILSNFLEAVIKLAVTEP